jgi:hypothetical protein
MKKLLFVGLLVLLVLVIGFVFMNKKSEKSVVGEKGQKTVSLKNNTEKLSYIKYNWQSIQEFIDFRPSYHNQNENSKGVWRKPNAVQFIGSENVLVRFEDDNNVSVAVLNFKEDKVVVLEVFKNQGDFTLSDWQKILNKYGEKSYLIETYTTSLIRNNQIVNFTDLTKVSENIFTKNYWE